MKMTGEEIKEAIAAGRIRALSLDTSAIDEKGRHLERGLLHQLRQFKKAESRLIVSDIVVRETLAHLTQDATKAKAELEKALKSLRDSWRIPEDKAANTMNELLAGAEPVAVASARWMQFAETCGIEIVSTDEFCKAGDLAQRYFDIEPPFENRADKKKEFPDAMALLSIEGWAIENETNVLIVTGDKGWVSFCEASEHLVALRDLGDALESFHHHDPGNVLPNIVQALREGGDPFGIRAAVAEALSEQSDQFSFDIEAYSDLGVEEDIVEVIVKEAKPLLGDEGDDAEPVNRAEDYLVIRFVFEVKADVVAYFSFTKWDSVDKENIPFGSGSVRSEQVFDVEVLVTLLGNTHRGITIDQIEVLPYKGYLEFGEIEPDWMNDHDAAD